MTYFQRFPLFNYDIQKNQRPLIVTNILKRVKFLENAKRNSSIFFEYQIKDSDKPESIAHEIYGSTEYFWIVFHFNDIINPYEWVRNPIELEQYVQKKYGDINGIHHYEDSNGITVNSDNPGASPVTNFTYENSRNEAKRKIRLLDPIYVEQVEQEFIQKINNDASE